MIDAEMLIRTVESGHVPADGFPHERHLLLTFAYLERYPLPETLMRLRDALSRLAANHGEAERYHETVTFAYAMLVHERRARRPGATWEEFRAANSDLFEWRSEPALLAWYDRETLFSDAARRRFVMPRPVAK